MLCWDCAGDAYSAALDDSRSRPGATVLIACGGAAYIAGAVCFALRKPNPIPGWFEFHEVFHLGTVIGYACHVVAIYLIVCAL